MSLNVDDFKSKLVGGGARPSLFRVTCNFPSFAGGDPEFASFMIKGAQIPADVIGMITVPFRGRQVKIAGNRTFEDLNLTIINDEGYKIRRAFEDWMSGINDHVDNVGATNPTDYQADIAVEQLDQQGFVVRSYVFRGCFPTNVAAIDLNFETIDAIEEYAVTLAYQYWEAR